MTPIFDFRGQNRHVHIKGNTRSKKFRLLGMLKVKYLPSFAILYFLSINTLFDNVMVANF